MKKSNLVLALAACVSFSSVMPAFAEGDSGLDKTVEGTMMVPRAAGLGVGMLVGVPIAIVRHTAKSYVDLTQKSADKVAGKMGGKDSGPACGVLSLVTLPAAVVVGTVKGSYCGTKNAMVHGFNEPLNPSGMSIGKLED